jgi:hypothetical protein
MKRATARVAMPKKCCKIYVKAIDNPEYAMCKAKRPRKSQQKQHPTATNPYIVYDTRTNSAEDRKTLQ